MTILETKQVCMYFGGLKAVEQQGMEVLEGVGLREYGLNKAGNMAYGTQRKVENARATGMCS